MTIKAQKLNKNSFGANKCGEILVERLEELKNPMLTRRFLHIYTKSRGAINRILWVCFPNGTLEDVEQAKANYLFFRRQQIDEWHTKCHWGLDRDLIDRLKYVIGHPNQFEKYKLISLKEKRNEDYTIITKYHRDQLLKNQK